MLLKCCWCRITVPKACAYSLQWMIAPSRILANYGMLLICLYFARLMSKKLNVFIVLLSIWSLVKFVTFHIFIDWFFFYFVNYLVVVLPAFPFSCLYCLTLYVYRYSEYIWDVNPLFSIYVVNIVSWSVLGVFWLWSLSH